jgi:poly(hydroxyalkanoate) depolymerase family esterase
MHAMVKRSRSSSWSKTFSHGLAAITRQTLRLGRQTMRASLRVKPPPKPRARRLPVVHGDWLAGVVVGGNGGRRFRLYRPPDLRMGERLPLLVMLHGCKQDANAFALSTRMNQIAARERFLVLYPEQDRLAHPQGCWNWYDTRSGRAYSESALIMKMVDRMCLRQPVDPERIAIAGLSAGGSMAALLVTQHPERFKAVALHSGIPPGMAHSTLTALGAMHGHPSPASPMPFVSNAAPWPPLLVIHGQADGVVAPSNGRAAAQIWADAVGARACPERAVQRGQRHPMTVTDFKCGNRIASTLVEIARLGHAWSGGAAAESFSDKHGPDASRLVWAFALKRFREQAARLPARAKRVARS